MDFLKSMYPQESLANALRSSNIPMDGTIAMPWAGNQLLLTDSTGNALGYVSENLLGGVTITDQHMAVQGITGDLPGGGQSIMDASYNQQAFTVENPAGGEMLYTNDFQLESMSFASHADQSTYYSTGMDVLGVASPVANGIQYNFGSSTLDASVLPSLKGYISTGAVEGSHALGSGVLPDVDLDIIDSGLGILDWL